MLIILVLILLLIWSAVVWTIYSNFLVFYSNFSESENYHKAYYASISALERWELVVKQHKPWYMGNGGFILWVWTWSIYRDPFNNPIDNWWSDGSLSWFSYFEKNQNKSSVFRTVNSRATRIPKPWKWNVERMFSDSDSSDYNTMDYENAEVFLLYYDNSKPPYTIPTNEDISNSNPDNIVWTIRLPQKLLWHFWSLNTETPLLGFSWSLPWDDALVDWQVRWSYCPTSDCTPFTIYSTQTINLGWNKPKVEKANDSVFRESDINGPLWFMFQSNRSPIISPNGRWTKINQDGNPVIISQNEQDLKSLNGFNWIINDSRTTNTQLRFSLLNLVRWESGTSYTTYPFLEYYIEFLRSGNPVNVSDKYYTINWEWNFNDYQVNTIIQKPTTKESILWSFTSIF